MPHLTNPLLTSASNWINKKFVDEKWSQKYSFNYSSTVQYIRESIDKHNAKNGRGGAAEAARKYGITQLTISKWMKETGSPAPKRKNSADFNKTISRLTDVHKEMATLQDKLDALRKEYVELKSVL